MKPFKELIARGGALYDDMSGIEGDMVVGD